MAWARYDDEFPMNRKVGRLIGRGKDGVAAIGLHLLANTYCRHNGTAGHVEPHVPNLLVGPIGRKLAQILEAEGMFDPDERGGWMIHDYAEFHDPNDPDPDRSAADRKRELSEKRAAAGRIGGLSKAAKQTASKATDLPEAKGVANAWQTPSPDPVPVPKENSLTTHHHPHGSGDDDSDPRFASILTALVEARIAKWPTKANALAHRTSVTQSVLDQHGDTIRQFLASKPDHPAELCVKALAAREIA